MSVEEDFRAMYPADELNKHYVRPCKTLGEHIQVILMQNMELKDLKYCLTERKTMERCK